MFSSQLLTQSHCFANHGLQAGGGVSCINLSQLLSLRNMHKYFLKIPWWVTKVFPRYTWRLTVADKTIYLTFDDGPHPTITPWVLAELKRYGAAATFFCIGKNVEKYPGVYQQILASGHRTGNHTYSHPNGWKTEATAYLEDVKKAAGLIESTLFRPPYGRITRKQAKGLTATLNKKDISVVMWDVLSADFDLSVSPEACVGIVLKHVRPGSIVVFHDSEKAYRNLQTALPLVLKELSNRGYRFATL